MKHSASRKYIASNPSFTAAGRTNRHFAIFLRASTDSPAVRVNLKPPRADTARDGEIARSDLGRSCRTDRVRLRDGKQDMSLIHQFSAGLVVFGGLLPVQIQAQWPGPGCGCGGATAQIAPMAPIMPMAPISPIFPSMGPMTSLAPSCGPVCGQDILAPRPWGPRMRQPRSRPWVYRSRTVMRGYGQSMFGDTTMGLPMGDCGCEAAPMITPQAPMIVPQATLIPQQLTTYVDVPKTVLRQEAVQVQVPTTTYKQVAVDEGGYQQVWVPKMVTKSVPQTVMQTQVQYRQVPHTIMERVPQVSTQWVPSTIASSGHPTIAGLAPYPIATATTVSPEYNPPPVNPVPNPVEETAQRPTPVVPQTSQVQEWQQVKQRQNTIQQQKYEVEAIEESAHNGTGYRVPKAAGRFSSKR